MDDLDEYLTNAYHVDRRDLGTVERLLGEAAATLAYTYQGETGWPYELRLSDRGGLKEEAPKEMSASTTAMVLLAAEKTLGTWGRGQRAVEVPRSPAPKLDKSIQKELRKTVDK